MSFHYYELTRLKSTVEMLDLVNHRYAANNILKTFRLQMYTNESKMSIGAISCDFLSLAIFVVENMILKWIQKEDLKMFATGKRSRINNFKMLSGTKR